MGKTLAEIIELIIDNNIKMIDFKLTDIDGRWRHLSIPAERLTESTMEHGIGFDGSNYGYAPIENSDMVFIPVLESAVIDRYAEVPTLSMIGDVRVIDLPKNRPFDQYPRNVAIRALEYMKEIGVADQMVIGPEYEFYLFDDCFSALDMNTERKIKENLKDLKDSSILIVSQRISTIMDADEILVIDNGEIVDRGTHDKLVESCDIYREIANIQIDYMEALL